MKKREQLSKWAAGFLGVVCLILLFNLVRRFSQIKAGTTRPAGTAAVAAKAEARSAAASAGERLSRYDPELKLDLLKKLQSRPLPQMGRDPFASTAARPAPAAAPQEVAAAPPPPPPPPPLKAVGYMDLAGGVREAYVSFEEQVYSVHEGDTIAGKFKVVKVTPTEVEVQDGSSNETIKLPITQ